MSNIFRYGFLELQHHFRMWAQSHRDISAFEFGDFELIMTQERSTISGMIFWLETPDIGFNDQEQQVFDGSFVVLKSSKPDDWKKSDTIREECYQVCMDFIKRLLVYAEDDLFELELKDISIYLIDTIGAQNDIGWRVNYKLKVNHSLCDRNCKWDDSLGSIIYASFEWTNNPTNDNSFNVSISNTTMPSEFIDEINWSYQVDDQEIQADSGPELNLTENGEWLKIKMVVTDTDGKESCANALISKKQNCGFSLPFKQY